MKWPISIATTIFMLFQMLIQSIQCLMVTHPSGWLTATGGIILFALLNQFYFEKSGAWVVYSSESIKRYKFNNNIYISLMLLYLGGAFQLYRYPSRIAEIIWGFVALFLSIMALYMQYQGCKWRRNNWEFRKIQAVIKSLWIKIWTPLAIS